MKLNTIILLLFFTVIGCTTNKVDRKLIINDLDFIYKTINKNHPGIYNNEDKNFKYILETGYKKAKQTLLSSKNLKEQQEIISDFIKSFDDSHLYVLWNNSKKKKILFKTGPQFSISHSENQVIWITLPTFELNNNDRKNFNIILQEIEQIRNKRIIIFDLRGNTGGNSAYGSEIIDKLYGKDFTDIQRAKIYKDMYIDWRASPDNLSYLKSINMNDRVSWIKNIINGMQKSLNDKIPFYKEKFMPKIVAKKEIKVLSQVYVKIIVLTDSGNVSAALDFIDELKMMQSDVILIGKQTKADRLYMEVRNVDLPSNLGIFIFPMKVYRNRPRKDNMPYIPDIEIDLISIKQKI